MTTFSFHDERLTAAYAVGCDLHIVAGADGCALLVSDAEGHVVALKRWHFSRPASGHSSTDTLTDLRGVLIGERMFAWSFRRVRWAWVGANATLVPRRLFRAEDLPAYFKLLLHPAAYVYGYDELPELDCFVVYALDTDWVRLAEQYLPQAVQTHFAQPLLRSWRSVAPSGDYDVRLPLHQKSAQIAVFDRQNLLFYNTFTFNHANDLLYFTLLTYEQFRLNPAEIPLTISGHLLEDSDGWRTLYRFVEHLRFAALPQAAHLPEAARELPDHCQWDVVALSRLKGVSREQ